MRPCFKACMVSRLPKLKLGRVGTYENCYFGVKKRFSGGWVKCRSERSRGKLGSNSSVIENRPYGVPYLTAEGQADAKNQKSSGATARGTIQRVRDEKGRLVEKSHSADNITRRHL